MARRVVVALLGPVVWAPPGIDPVDWRTALAEDVVDLLATLNEVETAVAVTPADRWLADAVVWPGMAVHEVPEPTVNAVFAALHRPGRPAGDGEGHERSGGNDHDSPTGVGYDQAAVVAGDAPDVPGLTIGKLLRPLSSRPVAVAPAEGAGPGLLGVAARLPVPGWLPALELDSGLPATVRAAAPRPGDLAVTPAWHRLRGPADLAFLDPAVEGWETTRALLSGAGRPG
ncbi:hypothetical protein [Micromonospora deserti]|uniref:Uncharacterized protein n=1 Tax=Micromonospora deserti TaxID=2070366 RepID=A0A2W2DAX6_9ACTN|nr:hypothetical protein [Micromonospora deserti]PZF94206.1 hypothetical protein C1I99_19655 [Micromonospora deserti]